MLKGLFDTFGIPDAFIVIRSSSLHIVMVAATITTNTAIGYSWHQICQATNAKYKYIFLQNINVVLLNGVLHRWMVKLCLSFSLLVINWAV